MFIPIDERDPGTVALPSTETAPKVRSVRVLRVRLKDKHVVELRAKARAVNMVWNYANDLSMKVLDREGRFIGAFEMQSYLNGASAEGLCIGSAVFQQVAEEFVTRRKQFKKRRLAWRKSGGSKRSLGWIPFKARSLGYKAGQVTFQGMRLSLWDSYGLAAYANHPGGLGSGTISEDSRGRWYLNICVNMCAPEDFVGPVDPRRAPTSELGIDLGLKDFAAHSDGAKVAAERFYRDLEPALAVAQRAGKKNRAKAIHAKISNRRKDFLHKLSTDSVRENRVIIVGNVNASALAKTSMAKSVLDAGWSAYRTMLQYKGLPFGDCAGSVVREVNESFSTQDCSACGAREGPKGLSGLAVRFWTCGGCGVTHDRDVNGARNILLTGQAQLALEMTGTTAPSRPHRKVRAAARVSNKDSGNALVRDAMAGVGHGPLAVGIPLLPAQAAAVG